MSHKISKLTQEHGLRASYVLDLKDIKPTEEAVKNTIESYKKIGYKLVYYQYIDRTHGLYYSLVFKRDQYVALLTYQNNSGNLALYGENPENLQQESQKLYDLIPVVITTSEEVLFTMWRRDSRGGAVNTPRRLVCPSVDEIKSNYSENVNQKIDYLTGLDEPDKHGSIILWHGPPGTGKTHMIRGISRHWSKKFDSVPEIILDPDSLFGEADYLYNVLCQEPWMRKSKKRLIIIEDHASIFTEEARKKGGAFSRLLNVTDGLIGQGQELVFLLTANERIDIIDDAIMRSGRCLQELHFPNLSPEEAKNWAEKHLADPDQYTFEEDVPLSDLYALQRGDTPSKKYISPAVETFGFA